MITPAYARLMAAYNQWQNESLYGAAATLSEAARRQDRGAFFRSIHGTLSHILWGDRIWLSRFTSSAPPPGGINGSSTAYDDWGSLRVERGKTDAQIAEWTDAITTADIAGDLKWVSAGAGCEFTQPRWLLITHFFNHHTHHRGQTHAMLTAAGAKPADTDIPFLPTLDREVRNALRIETA